MSRKDRHPHSHHVHDPENLDRWLVSYADFITLLFAFFVVMYALSSLNEDKYQVYGAAIMEAMGSQPPVKPDSSYQLSESQKLLKSLVEHRDAKQLAKLHKQQERLKGVAEHLSQLMTPLLQTGQVSIALNDRGIVVDIKASALFEQGDATLQAPSIPILSEIATILRTEDNAIEIEGHTDNVLINTPRFPSNWELSSARASSVARLFIDLKVKAERLTVIGAADNHPIASNDTAEGRARNRRISVTLMSHELAK